MELDADLMAWNYGANERLTSPEIVAGAPDWLVFRDGCPQGESPDQVAARVDRVIARLRGGGGAGAGVRPWPSLAGAGGPLAGVAPLGREPLPSGYRHAQGA